TDANMKVREKFNGFVGRISQVKILDAARGTSNVIFIGEKYINTTKYLTGTDPGDNEGMYAGCDNDTLRTTQYVPLRDDIVDQTRAFGSAHASGINACFGDGSVRFIEYNVDATVFYLMGDRTGD